MDIDQSTGENYSNVDCIKSFNECNTTVQLSNGWKKRGLKFRRLSLSERECWTIRKGKTVTEAHQQSKNKRTGWSQNSECDWRVVKLAPVFLKSNLVTLKSRSRITLSYIKFCAVKFSRFFLILIQFLTPHFVENFIQHLFISLTITSRTAEQLFVQVLPLRAKLTSID